MSECKDGPLVSVIIPCYNYGKYLEAAIESVFDQSYKLIEIIIIDDGSTDRSTAQVLKKYRGKKAKIVRTSNRGPGAARNTGFKYSRGEYILLLDADDLFHSSFVEKAVKILNECVEIGVVSAWTLCFGDEDFIWYPQGGDLENFLASTTCPVCALVRRDAWNDAGGFDENFLVGYEDWDFWIRVTKNNWLIYIIPEILFYYRQKRNSRVKETFARHLELYENIKKMHPDVFNRT